MSCIYKKKKKKKRKGDNLTLLRIFSGNHDGRTGFKICKISGETGSCFTFPASILTSTLCNILLLPDSSQGALLSSDISLPSMNVAKQALANFK